jgi:hypothetical protein
LKTFNAVIEILLITKSHKEYEREMNFMPKEFALRAETNLNELSKSIADQKILDTADTLVKSSSMYTKARANPKLFLSEQGVKVPPETEVRISRSKQNLSGQITITVCIQYCRQVGQAVVCVQICATGTIAL